MLYLLDANVLIDANRDYYAVDRVPEFWEWLIEMGKRGKVKIPQENYEEVVQGKDNASEWLKYNKEALLLNEAVSEELVTRVIEQGYGIDLNDVEIEKVGHDPFLIAYALVDFEKRVVVTTETSKPKKERANRKIPDVCKDFKVSCLNTYALLRVLDFTTKWTTTQSQA